MKPVHASPLPSVCIFYAGTLLGFSFIATPAKFFSPGVAMSDLLLVGRTTFGVFVWVEAALVVIVAALAYKSRAARLPVAITAAIVAAQYLALRPILDARVTAIIEGAPPEPSGLHHIYGVLELAKLGTLLWIARTTRDTPASRQTRTQTGNCQCEGG